MSKKYDQEHQRLLVLMRASEQIREAVGALVAGLVADGFDQEQARIIVTGVYRSLYRAEEETE